MRDFRQVEWDEPTEEEWRSLLGAAVREDLARQYDWTTVGLLDPDALAAAWVVARTDGVIAGLPAAAMTATEFSTELRWEPQVQDSSPVKKGQAVARISGPARGLLTAERTLLNVLERLSGIATLTARFVAAVEGTKARIYDTRKTTPGWRRLEKYAVRMGGGHNHRLGLYDAVLIKDNHLAIGAAQDPAARFTPAEAVRRIRNFLAETFPTAAEPMIVEVEVDDLRQLTEVLPERPDIVLLDNMSLDDLREAVEQRDRLAPQVELEASGGIRLETVAAVARTGVDRISVGSLTHSAPALDVGLDWGE